MCPAEEVKAEISQRPIVLLVEDEALLRLSIADRLREHGFVVIEAASGDEARDLIMAGVTADLVMSDITMPGALDGAGLAVWLAARGVKAPIILTSGLSQTLAEARTRCPHVAAFLAKPYDPSQLINRIEAVIAASNAA